MNHCIHREDGNHVCSCGVVIAGMGQRSKLKILEHTHEANSRDMRILVSKHEQAEQRLLEEQKNSQAMARALREQLMITEAKLHVLENLVLEALRR